MANSTHLQLPYIEAAQAQKHVTHNEAIRKLDAIVMLSVLDRDLATPPGSPADGDRYIVAASPTGAWAGQAGKIAAWQDGAWAFYTAKTGWRIWIEDEAVLVIYNGTSYVGPSFNNVPLLGVNTTADTTNRLAVSSAAVLLNHAGAGHQVKVNKNAAADTASFLFQTGFSGRAEIGTLGTDDFEFKVSPDGSAWTVALRLEKTSGQALATNGTAALPAYSFQGDADTGMWRAAADTLAWSIGGAEHMRLGSVGLGVGRTAADGYKLDVLGNGRVETNTGNVQFMIRARDGRAQGFTDSYNNTAANGSALTWRRFRGTADTPSAVADNDILGSFLGQGWDGAASIIAGQIHVEADGTVSTGIVPGRWRFTTRDGSGTLANRMVIKGSGNVGIGTTSPSTTLHVAGPVRVQSYTVAGVPSASASGAGAMIYVSNESGGAVIAFSDGTNWRRVTDRAIIS
jgi:hypothetical protein